MSDDLGAAMATALKRRFPEPEGVELLSALRTEPTHPRRRTRLAVAACVAAVVVVAVVAVALSIGGSRNEIASGPSPGNSKLVGPTETPACRPSAAEVTVRLGGPRLLGNRVPVKVRAALGDEIHVVARFGTRDLTRPSTDSRALNVICSTRGQTASTYFRAVHTGSATVTSGTSGCRGCMQLEFVAHIEVVANNKGCCPPSTSAEKLMKIGVGAARAQGAVAETITAVRSTHAHAVRVTMQAGVDGVQPVWVVQIKTTHEFVCRSCPGPRGSSVHGRFLLLVLDRSDLRQLDGRIMDRAAPLRRLGHVITVYSH